MRHLLFLLALLTAATAQSSIIMTEDEPTKLLHYTKNDSAFVLKECDRPGRNSHQLNCETLFEEEIDVRYLIRLHEYELAKSIAIGVADVAVLPIAFFGLIYLEPSLPYVKALRDFRPYDWLDNVVEGSPLWAPPALLIGEILSYSANPFKRMKVASLLLPTEAEHDDIVYLKSIKYQTVRKILLKKLESSIDSVQIVKDYFDRN